MVFVCHSITAQKPFSNSLFEEYLNAVNSVSSPAPQSATVPLVWISTGKGLCWKTSVSTDRLKIQVCDQIYKHRLHVPVFWPNKKKEGLVSAHLLAGKAKKGK